MMSKYLFYTIALLLFSFQLLAAIEIKDVRPATNVSACDGMIAIQAQGSSGPFTILLNHGAPVSNINGIYTFSNLCIGSYTITVTDRYGCIKTLTASIVECNTFGVSLDGQGNSCENSNTGFIEISPEGGTSPYKYFWSSGHFTEDIHNVQEGTYTVTVVDFNGCTTTATYFLDQEVIHVDIDLTASSGATNGCNGVIATDIVTYPVQVSYSIEWSNGATTETISQLCPGAYTATITTTTGCTKVITQIVNDCSGNVPPVRITDFDLSKTKDCTQAGGGEITAIITGGVPPFTFVWHADNGYNYSAVNNPTAPNILQEGTYVLTVIDGCFNPVTTSVYVPCACSGWGVREVDIRQESPCVDPGDSKLVLEGVCWSSNIPKPNPFDFKIIWPNNQQSTVSVTNFALCGGGNSAYTVTGPSEFAVNSPANYFVAIIDEYGCLENKCFSFDYPTEVTGQIKQRLIDLEPSYYDNYTEAYTGCFKCTSCRFGCSQSAGACDEGLVQSDFEYQPESEKNPCTNAQIGCNADESIMQVPVWVQGTEFIHWNEQLPSDEEGFCRYKGACYFPPGTLNGIDDQHGVYVETVFEIENENCGTIPPDYEDCPSVIREYRYTAEPCYFDVRCATTGELLAQHVIDLNGTGYCVKLPLPGSGDLSCAVYFYCRGETGEINDIPVDSWLTTTPDGCLNPPQSILEEYGSPDVFDIDGDGNVDELILQDCSEIGFRPNAPETEISFGTSGTKPTLENLHLYPNPFNYEINILNNNNHALYSLTVEIYDLLGKLCYTQKVPKIGANGFFTLTFNETIPTGAYIISVINDQKEHNFFVLLKSDKD